MSRPLSQRGDRSIWRDIAAGDAGFWPRLLLGLIGGVAVTAAILFVLAVIEETGGMDEPHVAVAVGLGGVAWFFWIGWLFRDSDRGARVVRTVFMLVIIWVLVVSLAVVIDAAVRNEELFIAADVFAGIAATLLIVAAEIYRGLRGRWVQDESGGVNVACPSCGYSMVGLKECTCPECGESMTLDKLIAAQDYDAHRGPARGTADESRAVSGQPDVVAPSI